MLSRSFKEHFLFILRIGILNNHKEYYETELDFWEIIILSDRCSGFFFKYFPKEIRDIKEILEKINKY